MRFHSRPRICLACIEYFEKGFEGLPIFSALPCGFCRLRSSPRRSFVRCFIDHGGSIKSQDPSSRFPLSFFFISVLCNLFLSLPLLVVKLRNFFSDATKDSEHRPHSRVWFFGFSEDDRRPVLRENKRTTKIMRENSSALPYLSSPSCWIEMRCSHSRISSLSNNNRPARFFGFSLKTWKSERIGRLDSW